MSSTKPIRVLSVFGTRPEAIKMAPVVKGLMADSRFESLVCVTAQHRQMLDQVLDIFEIVPDDDLNLMRPNQDLFQITTGVLEGIKPVLQKVQPDMVLVQGDTTTAMAVALGSFYLKIPVGHVEAGLRTHNIYYPFPEEVNRIIADAVSALHFAPTEKSRQNLLNSGVSEKTIVLTGNTVIDALFYTLDAIEKHPERVSLPGEIKDLVNGSGQYVLVTTHRRENFGEPLNEICAAIMALSQRFPALHWVLPVHPNPNVQQTVRGKLGENPRIHLIEPLEYVPFCQVMAKAHLVLTDSGGIQEEAPSLSKPVLVLRDETERPEAVEMGTVKLVGPHYDRILTEGSRLLSDEAAYHAMAKAANPYGDGKATPRILDSIVNKIK